MKRLILLAACVGMSMSVAWAQGTAAPPKPADKPAAAQPAKPADKPSDKKPEPAASGGQDYKAMEEAWENAGKPGPMHEHLKAFEGEWETEVKSMMPGAPDKPDKGTMKMKMEMGGRFISMDYDGRRQGKFLRGHGYMGYNNVEKRYESVWMDSMGSGIDMNTGQADAAGKVFTLTGEMTDPSNGKKMKTREVTTVVSKDTIKMEFFGTVDGKEMKMEEITFTRAGKADKAADKPADKPKGAPDKK